MLISLQSILPATSGPMWDLMSVHRGLVERTQKIGHHKSLQTCRHVKSRKHALSPTFSTEFPKS